MRENLRQARKELSNLVSTVNEFYVPDQTILFKGESERLRWSILPIEAKNLLVSQLDGKFRRRHPPLNPFRPKAYPVGSSKDENIGSLHGGESKVQNPAFLLPVQEQVFVQKSEKFVKNSKAAGGHKKWSKKPLSGLWSKDKSSKSKSIDNLSIVGLESNSPSSKNLYDDLDHTANTWNKLTVEERMISYLMREYIESNREKIFSQNFVYP